MDKKAALASTKEMLGAFPDVAITPSTMWAAGDYVAVAGTFAGTQHRPSAVDGHSEDRQEGILRFFEVMRFEKGQIKEDWLFYNGAAFAGTADREVATASVAVTFAVVAVRAGDVRLDDAGVASVDDRHVHAVARMI